MKAVNLIPDEQRRGAGGTSGRSGGVAYAFIGVLAGLVVMVALYAMTSSTITSRQSKLDDLNAQVTASQTQNTELATFSAKAAEAAARKSTVTQLVSTRFGWAHALQEIPRVLPKDVWLETMTGTVAPATADGSTATTPTGPTIDIQGCTTSQDEVAKLMTSLRLIDEVSDVALIKSAKADTGSGSAGSCTVKSSYPSFDVTVTFNAPGTDAAATSTATTDNSPATALGTTTTPTATAAPASSIAATPTATLTPPGGGIG